MLSITNWYSAIQIQQYWVSYIHAHEALVDLSCSIVPIWPSGNALVSINVVTSHWIQLVPGWVIVLGRVNHLGTESGTQVDSAWAIPS